MPPIDHPAAQDRVEKGRSIRKMTVTVGGRSGPRKRSSLHRKQTKQKAVGQRSAPGEWRMGPRVLVPPTFKVQRRQTGSCPGGAYLPPRVKRGGRESERGINQEVESQEKRKPGR